MLIICFSLLKYTYYYNYRSHISLQVAKLAKSAGVQILIFPTVCYPTLCTRKIKHKTRKVKHTKQISIEIEKKDGTKSTIIRSSASQRSTHSLPACTQRVREGDRERQRGRERGNKRNRERERKRYSVMTGVMVNTDVLMRGDV